MRSRDFIDLVTKIHKEKYDVHSIKLNAERVGDAFLTEVTVVLEKDGKYVKIESSELDFIKYSFELRQVVDTGGEFKFRRVKNLEQYYNDIEMLIDEKRDKLKDAANKIISKEFAFAYDPPKLVDRFLKNQGNKGNVEFLCLKRDYHYILAKAFLRSQEMLNLHKGIIQKYPQTKNIFTAMDKIMKSFWPTKNPIKNYNYYRSFLDFDLDELANRMSTELLVIDDTAREFRRRGKIDADVIIPKTMDIYSKLIELSAPIINLIRIGLELKKGNSSPRKKYGLGQNIRILKADSDYGFLFCCLDEQIRHADAHAFRRIDKATRKVYLLDARTGIEKIIGTYTFNEFADIINTMRNQFFPAIFPTLVLFDIATFDLLLASTEYKLLLLTIDNS